MKTKMMMLAVTMVIVALAGSAGALVLDYVETTDQLWSNPDNWTALGVPTGAVPTALDTVQISGPDGAGYQYVTINNGTNALSDDLSFGVDGGAGGNLTVETGGTLTVGDIMAMARVPGMSSELNLNGGTISIGSKFRMDVDGSTLNMTGGLLDITNSFDMDAGSSDAGGGTVNMYGGLIDIGTLLDMDQRGGTVNLYGGTMDMAGDVDMTYGGRGSGIVNIYGETVDPSGDLTDGGTLIIGDDLEMGDSDALVNMYGGTMIIKSLFKMNSSNSGTFNLIGGTVTAIEEGQGLLMQGGGEHPRTCRVLRFSSHRRRQIICRDIQSQSMADGWHVKIFELRI